MRASLACLQAGAGAAPKSSWLRPSGGPAVTWRACSATSSAGLGAARRPQPLRSLLLSRGNAARALSVGSEHGEGSQGAGGRRKVTAAALAVGTVGAAWLTFEDRRGGLSGGPFEPLTLYVAAVRPCDVSCRCLPAVLFLPHTDDAVVWHSLSVAVVRLWHCCGWPATTR